MEIHSLSSTFTPAFCLRAFSKLPLSKAESKQKSDFAKWEREKIEFQMSTEAEICRSGFSRATCTKKELKESAKESPWIVSQTWSWAYEGDTVQDWQRGAGGELWSAQLLGSSHSARVPGVLNTQTILAEHVRCMAETPEGPWPRTMPHLSQQGYYLSSLNKALNKPQQKKVYLPAN